MRKLAFLAVILGTILNASAGALDTWTNVATTPYGDLNQVIYGNGVFVAIANNPSPSGYKSGISTSTDGIHWQHQGDTVYNMSSLTFGNGTFVISKTTDGGDIGAVDYSTDGTNWGTWRGTPGPSPNGLSGVAFGGGVFVAVGYFYEGSEGDSYVSTNGQTWSANAIEIAPDFNPVGIAYWEDSFNVVGGINLDTSSNYMYYSVDGESWDDESPTITGSYTSIFNVNGILIFGINPGGGTVYHYLDARLSVAPPPVTRVVGANDRNEFIIS